VTDRSPYAQRIGDVSVSHLANATAKHLALNLFILASPNFLSPNFKRFETG